MTPARAERNLAGTCHFRVPIGKPNGLARSKAALGKIPKGKNVCFVDELTLTGYDADGAVAETYTRPTAAGGEAAESPHSQDQTTHDLPPGLAPHQLVRALCAEGDTLSPQLIIDCSALSEFGGADSERVTRSIEIARRVLEEVPSFQIMRCAGWRPRASALAQYEATALEVSGSGSSQ